MTENEAIEELQTSIELAKMCTQNLERKREIQGYEMAIKALDEVQKYRKIEKDLKERYHANVDIPLLMHHFIETVFEGERHEGFCLLTNEDREAWEEYRAIGAPEECLRNKDFLDFLADKMNPSDFETYLRLYNALEGGDEE